MDISFLGTANAFGHGGRRRSHYFVEGTQNLLIDASYDAPAGLRSIKKTIKDIDEIYISHLHPDHFMALPQFALENFYVLKRENPIPTYSPPGAQDLITKAAAVFFNGDVTDHVSSLFDFIEIGENQSVETAAGKLLTFPADHTGNARMQIITIDDVDVGYTGDTAFVPETFEKLLKADITITEASSGSHFIPHHTTVQELLDYPIPPDKMVYLSHLGETALEMSNEIFPPLYMAYDGLKISI